MTFVTGVVTGCFAVAMSKSVELLTESKLVFVQNVLSSSESDFSIFIAFIWWWFFGSIMVAIATGMVRSDGGWPLLGGSVGVQLAAGWLLGAREGGGRTACTLAVSRVDRPAVTRPCQPRGADAPTRGGGHQPIPSMRLSMHHPCAYPCVIPPLKGLEGVHG